MRNAALLVMACICLLGVQSIGQAQLDTDLVGYWQFNFNGDDSSALDRDLDLVGDPNFGDGLIGCALSLTGNPNQFAQRPANDLDLDIAGDDFTFQIWVNFNSLPGEQTLIEKFTGGAGPGYTLSKLSNNRFQFFAAGVTTANTAVLTIDAGVWHQLVMRRIGSSLELFYDGDSVAQVVDTSFVTPTTNPLLIGERHNNQQFPVRGLIDEVAFWKRGLQTSEILELYNEGNGLAMVPDPEFTPGDVNLDGNINLLDVGPFIERLSTGDYQLEADMNQDCAVNLLDISPFIDAIGGG